MSSTESLDNSDEAKPKLTLYDALEVSQEASTDQIKKSYRQLARKYHPDKASSKELASNRINQINRAYEVLSDPLKKRIYDKLGTAGINQYDSTKEIGDGGWEIILLIFNPSLCVFIGIALFLFCICSITLLATITLRLQGVITSTWFLVLLPVWIIDMIIFGLVLNSIYFSFIRLKHADLDDTEADSEDQMLRSPSNSSRKLIFASKTVFSVIKFVVIVLFQVFLCFQLDQSINAWPLVMGFPLIYIVISYISDGEKWSFTQYRQQLEAELLFKTSPEFYCGLKFVGFLLHRGFFSISMSVFVLLVLINLFLTPCYSKSIECAPEMSWWVVMSPLFIYAISKSLLNLFEFSFRNLIRYSNHKYGKVVADENNPQELSSPGGVSVALYAGFEVIFYGLFLLPFCLFFDWIEHQGDFDPSLMMIPIYIYVSVFSLFALCVAYPCFACCVGAFNISNTDLGYYDSLWNDQSKDYNPVQKPLLTYGP